MNNISTSKTLFVLYQPEDISWINKVILELRNHYEYEYEIITKSLVDNLSKQSVVGLNKSLIKTRDIYYQLLNTSEINISEFNEETQSPVYPDHSIILVEINNYTKQVTRSIWASTKYFDDLGTFAPNSMRRRELKKALDKLKANE